MGAGWGGESDSDNQEISTEVAAYCRLVVMVGAVTTLTGALLVLVVAPVLSHLDLLWYDNESKRLLLSA